MATVRLLVLALMLGLPFAYAALATAQLNEDEARRLFEELGCTSCHREGGVAKPWDEMLKHISEWAERYESIDEAVRAEVTYFGGRKFESFDELMKVMGENVGAPEDRLRLLSEFLRSYFEAVRAGASQEARAEPIKGEEAAEQPGLETYAPYLVVGVAAVIVAAFVAAALALGRRR